MNETSGIGVQGLDDLFEKYRKSPDSYVFVLLADACRKIHRIDEALEICGKGIDHHPRYASGYVVKGKCHYDLNDHDTAKDTFEQVLTLDENNLVALKYLGMIAADRGHFDSARDYFQHILQPDPDNKAIKETMRLVEEKEQDGGRGEAESTEVDSTSGVTLEAASSGGLETSDELATLTLADIFASQGYNDKAIKICEELLKKNPRNQVVREKMKSLGGTVDDLPDQPPASPDDGGTGESEARAPEKPGDDVMDYGTIELGDEIETAPQSTAPDPIVLGGHDTDGSDRSGATESGGHDTDGSDRSGATESGGHDTDGSDRPGATESGGHDTDGADRSDVIELGGHDAEAQPMRASGDSGAIELGCGDVGEPLQVDDDGAIVLGDGSLEPDSDTPRGSSSESGEHRAGERKSVDDGAAIHLPRASADSDWKAGAATAEPANHKAADSTGEVEGTPGGFREIDPEKASAPKATRKKSKPARDSKETAPVPPQAARRAIDEKESMSHFRRWLKQMDD